MAILEVLISQTKVGNFANKVVIKKNITSRQVSMDYLQKDVILHFEYDNTFQKVKSSFWKENNKFERKPTPFPSFFLKPGAFHFDRRK